MDRIMWPDHIRELEEQIGEQFKGESVIRFDGLEWPVESYSRSVVGIHVSARVGGRTLRNTQIAHLQMFGHLKALSIYADNLKKMFAATIAMRHEFEEE